MSTLHRFLLPILATTIAGPVDGQRFRLPAGPAHVVFRQGEDILPLEELRRWTVGMGMSVGLMDVSSVGVAAQASYGGPYWYWTLGGGVWDGGTSGFDKYAVGINYNYNVFQSSDFRLRVGPQFGFGIAGGEAGGPTRSFSYGVLGSRAFNDMASVYGGIGLETVWSSATAGNGRRTDPSSLIGLYTRVGERLGVSLGVETLYADVLNWGVSTSVQFEPRFGARSERIIAPGRNTHDE